MRRWSWRGPARMVALALLAVGLAGCGGTNAASAKGTVSVAYAGALVNLMERRLGPAFSQATGYGYEGRGAGAVALANEIRSKLIAPDVFISASATAYKPLQGAANGDIVSWYITFAGDSMVIGYNPKSQYAARFAAAASGAEPWYQVLETPGLRLGRTDPKLDPKGVNTLYTLQLAEAYYHLPGLAAKIIGPDENPAQIFPEEELVARLTAGQLDAGFFYLNEVKDAGIPYITLPKQINLSDPSLASAYAAATYTSASGTVQHGAPILFSVTIPATVKNEAGAVAFTRYLLGEQGQALLTSSGFLALPITFTGDAAKVPAGLAQYARG